MEVINVVVGVRWWIGSDSVYANAFEKQQDYLLEYSKLHCHTTTNCETRGWACVCGVVCGILFLIFGGLTFVCWACVWGVKTHWAQVGL